MAVAAMAMTRAVALSSELAVRAPHLLCASAHRGRAESVLRSCEP